MHRRAAILLLAATIAGDSPIWSERPRDLLLITIDTLRADYLGCNGARSVCTPNLDRLARRGVNFTRARSPVPLTLPAHASILTGNYPPTHTVRSNGEYILPAEQLSLAEVLAGHGYQTSAFVASFVLERRFGVGQGFQHYDDRVWSGIEEIEKSEAERTADEVFEAFSYWLADAEDLLPRFTWIHLYDPHAPYEPPEPFRSQYESDPYAGEVAYADSIVGRILETVESSGEAATTLVAVVGDHGEGLGDHGEQTHSLLIYNSTLHVPMILWGPGTVPKGHRVDDLVRIIDLAPTLLDYLGIDQDFGEGVSLRPLIEGDDQDAPVLNLTAYSESLYPELALSWSPLRGLEDSEYRLILAPTPELFAVHGDPGEQDNVVGSEPAAFQRLQRQLVDSIRALEQGGSSPKAGTLDAETRAQLESLGYVAGSSRATSRSGAAVDPKDGIDLWNRIQLGIAQLGQGRSREAATTFESVLLDDSDIPLVYEYLGACWQQLKETDKAERVYRAALARGAESPQLHHELGRILLGNQEYEEAKSQLQAALALDPQRVVAHYDLGSLYRAQVQLDRAVNHYNRALELNPSYLWAWNGLAMTFAVQGQTQQATEAFRKVVAIAPDEAPGVFNLAVQLDRTGRTEEAVATYLRFLELVPNGDLAAQRRQADVALDRLQN